MTDTFSSNKDALEWYLKNCVSRNAEKNENSSCTLVFLAMLATRHKEWRWHLVCGPNRNMSVIMQQISDAGVLANSFIRVNI